MRGRIEGRKPRKKDLRALCDCTRPASVMYGSAYICEECARIEQAITKEDREGVNADRTFGIYAEAWHQAKRPLVTVRL